MCFDERKTESRNFPARWRAMCARTRVRRRVKRASDLPLIGPLLLLLAFFTPDLLGIVFDALALVRLGPTERADHRRNLADTLAVGAADVDRRRLLAGDLDIGRNRKRNVVAEAQLKDEILALHRRAVADAVDFEIDAVALGDTIHHVVDEGARRAPGHARAFRLVLRGHHHLAVFHRGFDLVVDDKLQRAELALGGEHPTGHLDGDALRDGDGRFADARHGLPQKTRHRISPPTLAARDSLSDITPRGVDRIEMPRPL